MPSDSLYEALAKAKSRPSRAYRAAKAALDVPGQGLEGYLEGGDLADKIQQRKLAGKTLSELLGRPVEGIGNLPLSSLKTADPALDYLAKVESPKNDMASFMAKFNLQQDAINKRQTNRQDFIREMVGSKGNREAVNQAKNAAQGLGYLDDLWNSYDKLSGAEQAGAGTPILEKLFPEVNAAKANVVRTAGFAEGGKNFTAHERQIIVDSFLPTSYENDKSKALKRRIGREYYLGTIDLYDAARLLGPAGDKLMEIADKARQRQSIKDSLIRQEMTGGGNELDDIFGSEGIQ